MFLAQMWDWSCAHRILLKLRVPDVWCLQVHIDLDNAFMSLPASTHAKAFRGWGAIPKLQQPPRSKLTEIWGLQAKKLSANSDYLPLGLQRLSAWLSTTSVESHRVLVKMCCTGSAAGGTSLMSVDFRNCARSRACLAKKGQ